MRVDCTATLKRGERHEEVDTQVVEEKLNKISLLIKKLDDLNSLCRGKTVANTSVSVNSGGGTEKGRGYKRRLLSVSASDEAKRNRLLSTISQLLADVLSSVPPRSVLPTERLKFFVQIARQAGMLPLRRDIECEAPELRKATTIDLDRDIRETTINSAKPRIGGHNYEAPTQTRPMPQTPGVSLLTLSLPTGAALGSNRKPVYETARHESQLPSTSVTGRERDAERIAKHPLVCSDVRNQTSSLNYQAARGQPNVVDTFQRTTHLPLIQRIILNFPPKNSTIGLERDVTTQNLMETLDDFALRPLSVLKGEKHVNKTAVSLYLRIKEKQTGSRDILKEQLVLRALEAKEDEKRELKILAESLPSATDLSKTFQRAYEKYRLKEPKYGLQRVRADFARVIARLYPHETACSESVLRLFMLGKYNLQHRTKWLHGIFELCKELQSQEPNLKVPMEIE